MRHIGVESERIMGKQLVTGAAQFTADQKMPHMKYGRVLRSPHPYAEIVKLDTSAAEAMPGVHAVVTYRDVKDDQYITNGYTPPKHCDPLSKIVL